MPLANKNRRVLRIFSLTILTFAAGCVAFYFIFFTNKRNEVIERNFRRLNAIALQVENRLSTINTIIGNAHKTRAAAKTGTDEIKYWQGIAKGIPHLNQSRERKARPHSVGTGTPDDDSPPSPYPQLLRISISPKAFTWIVPSAAAAESDSCTELNLDWQGALRETIGASNFDNVYLAAADGRVAFQLHRRHGSLRNLGNLQLFDERDKTVGFDSVANYGGLFSAKFHGTNHVLFAQPLLLPAIEDITTKQHWTLIADVKNQKFVNESLRLPTPVILTFIGLGVVLLTIWPLLNILASGRHTRIRRLDIIFMGLSATVGTALAAFFVTDVYFVTDNRRTYDLQLHELANRVDSNFRSEVYSAVQQLNFFKDNRPEMLGANSSGSAPQIEPVSAYYLNRESSSYVKTTHNISSGNDLAYFEYRTEKIADPNGNIEQKTLCEKNHGWYYPFFDRVILVDSSGTIQLKISPGNESIGLPNLSDRAYFKAIKNQIPWRIPRSDSANRNETFEVVISPHISWVSGAHETTIAVPFLPAGSNAPWIAAMDVTTLHSVDDIVLPRGFNLAIVDQEGKVKYHTVSNRRAVENLLTECSGNGRLATAIAGRRADWMTCSYWGANHRFYTKPIPGTEWSIAVFYDEDVWLHSLNSELLMVAGGLYVLNLLILLLAIAIMLSTGGIKLDWLWPSLANHRYYKRLIWQIILFVLFYITVMVNDFNFDHVLISALFLPIFFSLVTYFSLKRQRAFNLTVGFTYLALIGFGPLLACTDFISLGGAAQASTSNIGSAIYALRYFGWFLVIVTVQQVLQRTGLLQRQRNIKSLTDWRVKMLIMGIFLQGIALIVHSHNESIHTLLEVGLHIFISCLTIFALFNFSEKRDYFSNHEYIEHLHSLRLQKAESSVNIKSFRRTYKTFIFCVVTVVGVAPSFAYFFLTQSVLFDINLKDVQKTMADDIQERHATFQKRYAKPGMSQVESQRLTMAKNDDKWLYSSAFFNTELTVNKINQNNLVKPAPNLADDSGNSTTSHEDTFWLSTIFQWLYPADTTAAGQPRHAAPFGNILPRIVTKMQFQTDENHQAPRMVDTMANDSSWRTVFKSKSERHLIVRDKSGRNEIILKSHSHRILFDPKKFRSEEYSLFALLILLTALVVGGLIWAIDKFARQVFLINFSNPRRANSVLQFDSDGPPVYLLVPPLVPIRNLLDKSIAVKKQGLNLSESTLRPIIIDTDELLQLAKRDFSLSHERDVFIVDARGLTPYQSDGNVKLLHAVNKLDHIGNHSLIVIGTVAPANAFLPNDFLISPKDISEGTPLDTEQDETIPTRADDSQHPMQTTLNATEYSAWKIEYYDDGTSTSEYLVSLMSTCIQQYIRSSKTSSPPALSFCEHICREFYAFPWLRDRGMELALRYGGSWSGHDKVAVSKIMATAAEPFYIAAWHSCSSAEKIILANLAREGALNGKDPRDIHRLLDRNMIQLTPKPSVINHGFRNYLHRDDIQAEATRLIDVTAQSTWENMRTPVIIIVVLITAFFMITQHDVLDTTTAVISSIAVILPGVLRAFESFKSSAAQE